MIWPDDMTWQWFLHTGPLVRGIHRPPVYTLHKAPVMPSLNAPFFVNLNKLTNKQSSSWWFHPSWHACDVIVMTILSSIHTPILKFSSPPPPPPTTTTHHHPTPTHLYTHTPTTPPPHTPILTPRFFSRAAMTLRPAAGFCLETSMRDQVDFECDVTAYPYVTVIHHDREQRTFVNDYESVVSEHLQIIYIWHIRFIVGLDNTIKKIYAGWRKEMLLTNSSF